MFDAMDRLETIADPTARARAISEVLTNSKDRGVKLKEARRKAVLELMAREGATYRKVAAEIGVPLGTLQDIVKGYSRSWKDRPKKEPPASEE